MREMEFCRWLPRPSKGSKMAAMKSISRLAGRSALIALASGFVLLASPVSAQEIVQQLPSSGPGERLDQSLRILRSNPNDVFALVGAGEASLDLNDPAMALGHFQRADQINPRDKRVKIGMGRALVMLERPNDALAYFNEAERLGARESEFAADRGLAYDLIGNPTAAQADYRIAMKSDPSNTVIRRMAISLGISGKPNDAIRLLQPLIQRGDKGALRDEAFIRAMNDDQKGAQQIAQMAMPGASAAQFDPFFRRLPELNAAERARAVHFGDMPVKGTRYASAEMGAKPAKVSRGGGPGSGLIPEGEPLGTKGKTKKPSASQTRRDAEKAERERKAKEKEKENKRLADARAADAKKRDSKGSKTSGSKTAPPVRTVRADPVPPPPKVEPMRSTSTAAATPRPTPPPATAFSPPPSPPPVVVASAPPPPVTQIAMASPPPAIPGTTPAASSPAINTSLSTPAPAVSGDRASAVPQGISGASSSSPQPTSLLGPNFVGPVLDGTNSGGGQPAAVTTTNAPIGEPTDIVGSSLGPRVQSGEIVQALPPPPPPPPPKPKVETKAVTPAAKADSKGIGTAAKGKDAATTGTSKGKTATDAKGTNASKTTTTKGATTKDGKATTASKDGKDSKGTTTAKGKIAAKDDPKAKGSKATTGKDAKDSAGTKKSANTERYWLQVATGSDSKALGFDLKRLKSKYSFLAPLGGYTSPFRSTKRLLVGPFKTEAEAKAMESKARKAGLSGFVWTSPAGMDVSALPK